MCPKTKRNYWRRLHRQQGHRLARSMPTGDNWHVYRCRDCHGYIWIDDSSPSTQNDRPHMPSICPGGDD